MIDCHISLISNDTTVNDSDILSKSLNVGE